MATDPTDPVKFDVLVPRPPDAEITDEDRRKAYLALDKRAGATYDVQHAVNMRFGPRFGSPVDLDKKLGLHGARDSE